MGNQSRLREIVAAGFARNLDEAIALDRIFGETTAKNLAEVQRELGWVG